MRLNRSFALLGAIVLVAACSSSTSSSAPSASAAGATAPSASAGGPAAASASAAASGGAAASAMAPIGGVALATSPLGQIVTDDKGMTLYAFTKDTAGTSVCYDKCAAAWPAATVTGSVNAATGLDASKFTTVDRTDGTKQVKFGQWPLYYFAGDKAPGDTKGQALNDVWWVVDANGQLIKTPAAGGSASGGASASGAASPSSS